MHVSSGKRALDIMRGGILWVGVAVLCMGVHNLLNDRCGHQSFTIDSPELLLKHSCLVFVCIIWIGI